MVLRTLRLKASNDPDKISKQRWFKFIDVMQWIIEVGEHNYVQLLRVCLDSFGRLRVSAVSRRGCSTFEFL